MMPLAPRAFRWGIACIAMVMLAMANASAQRAPSAQKTPPVQTTPEPPPAPDPTPAKPENPGLFNEIGKLFVKPGDLFPSLKPSTGPMTPSPAEPGDAAPPQAVAPAAPVTPEPPPSSTATTAPVAPVKPAASLVPQVITGRATCPISANGAPDCKAGADRLCQDKGFSGGSSLGTDSAQTCSTNAILAGARHIRDICKTENFVTRAMCQ